MLRRRALTPVAAVACLAAVRSHGVKVVWSSSSFTYTHQKTLVIDGSKAIIMTANLTSEYYSTSRDFLVVDSSRTDAAAIAAVFAHRAVRPALNDNRELGLIISNSAIMSAIARSFAADFANGKHWA